MNFPSVRGGQGLSKGRRGLAWEEGGWLEAWNKGAGASGGSLRAWGLERAEGLGWGGWTLRGPDGCSFGRSLGRMEIPPVFYRTSSPSGPLPKRDKIWEGRGRTGSK